MTTKRLDCTHLIAKGIVRTERDPKGIVSRRQGNLAVVGARRFQYSPELVLRGALRQEIGWESLRVSGGGVILTDGESRKYVDYACVMAVLMGLRW
ncbi:hypothetical protein EV363DRAFT_1172359 [Boletus edulis]|nr:hypothetical protein EV363DRAFT_1172359 [Boletus edulis]